MLRATLGPDTRAPLRILCLGAHCDDIEIGCGGTLLRLLAERPGSHVDWVVFASTPQREQEARACAAEFVSGTAEPNVIVKSFRESYFPYVASEVKDFFEELKRTVQEPNVVFSHHRHACTRITGWSPS
jgi:LmbE family N-acetylglucosaminyl deacetylase